MPGKLDGRVALVFGAGSKGGEGWAIGQATAVAFSQAGARVLVVDVEQSAAEATEQQIVEGGGTAKALCCDITESSDVKRTVEQSLSLYGRIDILQNNVGVAHVGSPVDMSEETWEQSMRLNVGGAFLACKYVIPVMERQGSGVITNVSSISGLRWVGTPLIGYSTFKAALNMFTQSVALQYARSGIRSNAVIPGRMDTPMMRASFRSEYPDEKALVADKASICPTGKLGDAWDVANASVFLATDDAKYITGALMPVDGGVLCQS